MLASCLVNFVDPPLVQVNNKNEVISEAAQSVHRWHRDDEAEQVVNYRIKEFVHKGFGRQMVDGLEFIVDVQLRRHLNKTEQIDRAHQGVKYERIP